METNVETETEFPDTLVSEWILHEIYCNPAYLESLSRVNDERWYSDRDVGTLIGIVIDHYLRHHDVPTNEAVDGHVRYMCERGQISCEPEAIVRKFNDIVTKPIDVPSETVREAIELFVKKSGLFQTLATYIAARTEPDARRRKKVTFDGTYGDISKFYEFRLDNDIGLDYFNQFNRQLEYLLNPDIRLKTGVDAIDTWSNGGIPSEGNCLCAFQAGTNVGKSLFLGNLAYQMLKQDKCVVVITLELSALGYGRRLTALISGCNVDALAAYHVEMERNVESFRKEHPKAKLVIKEYPMHGTTTSDVDSYLENLHHDGIRPDLVIVDYLNLLTPSFCNKNEQLFIKVALVSEQLRAISKKYRIPIFTATQSSRGSLMDQETKLSDMAQSLGLAVAADLILGLYCYTEEESIVHMNCIKNRFGSKNYVARKYRIDRDTLEPIDLGDDSSNDGISAAIGEALSVKGRTSVAAPKSAATVTSGTERLPPVEENPPPGAVPMEDMTIF